MMKCFAVFTVVVYVLCTFPKSSSQQIDSLGILSLLAPQVGFLEGMCFNRSGNDGIFVELKQTIEECHLTILNGSELTLTFSTLEHSDPKEFYKFYMAQCNEPSAIQLRNNCNEKLKFLLKQCLNETELLAFNKIEDIAVRIDKVMCGMDNEKMRHFFSTKGQECLSDNVITIGFCLLSALPESVEDKQNFLFQLIEGRECKVVDDIEGCIMGELDFCEDKPVSFIFNMLFDLFRREFGCQVDAEEIKQATLNTSGTKARSSQIFLLTIIFIVSSLKY